MGIRRLYGTSRLDSRDTLTEERLRQVSLPELERWMDRILEAQQLDEVFVAE
jgi:hypothetical protein